MNEKQETKKDPSISLAECREMAERDETKRKFLAIFPSGPRVCEWGDPYMGIFIIRGIEGFVFDRDWPGLRCLPMSDGKDAA